MDPLYNLDILVSFPWRGSHSMLIKGLPLTKVLRGHWQRGMKARSISLPLISARGHKEFASLRPHIRPRVTYRSRPTFRKRRVKEHNILNMTEGCGWPAALRSAGPPHKSYLGPGPAGPLPLEAVDVPAGARNLRT